MIAIYSIIFWIFLALVTVFFVVFWSPSVLFAKQPYKSASVLWTRIILFFLGVKLKVEGAEKLDPNTNYVFMGNHISYADIFSLLWVLRDRNFMFMAKKELFKIPVFGFALKKIGMIPIEREDKKDGLKSLLQAAKRISEGYSVLLFPEGTRSADGTLGEFKRGAFLLAGRTGNKIAPFIISGSDKIMPKTTMKVYPFGTITVRFLDPIDTQGRKDKDVLDEVRGKMLNELGQTDNTVSGD